MDKKMTLSEYEEIARHRIQHLIDKYCYGSQQVFADRTGINKASVSQYVNGRNTPSSVTAEKIAKAFGCAPEWVMGFSSRDDSNDLADDERILVANYRKLSPIEKESIRNIIDKMANGATPSSSEKETTTTQVAPDVYTAAVKEVIVVSENGKKAQVVKLNADTPLSSIPALQKYNPKSAREALMQSPNFTQSNTISKKTARKKENAQ